MFRIIIVFLLLPFTLCSQNQFSEVTVNGGVSYSLWRGIHKIPFKDFEKQFEFTLGKQAAVDFSFFRRLSFGISYTYHKHILQIYDYTYTLNNIVYTEDPKQIITVHAIGFRGLFHSKDVYDDTDGIIDLYGGVQIFSLFIASSNTSNDPEFHQFTDSFDEIPGLVGGIRLYPTNFLGIYAECSIPGAYTFAAGISLRFGGKKKFFEN